MSREHVNLFRSEIKSETGVDKTTYQILRKKIIRTFMDAVESENHHDYDGRLIREFNNRCDQLGFGTDVKITPLNGGFTYTGNFAGIPSPVANNAITNENFTGNNSQEISPGAYPSLIENLNGHPIGPSANNNTEVQMSGWYFHSPMFTNTTNYYSLILGQLFSKESYNLLESGQLLGYGDFMQDRVLKLFGQNNAMASLGANSDFNSELNRLMFNGSPFTTPITMMGNTAGAPGLNAFQTGYWCRYDVGFHFSNSSHNDFAPSIPTNATGISFGCYVKIEKDDPLLDLNFGGMYIRQITGDGTNQRDFVDVVQVKGSNFTQMPSMMGTTDYATVAGTNGCYNWGNGRAFESAGGGAPLKLLETFPPFGTSVRALDTKLQTDARDWLLLSGRTPYITGDISHIPHTGINAVLFYGENHEHLGKGVSGLSIDNPGAVYFSQPFVEFLS